MKACEGAHGETRAVGMHGGCAEVASFRVVDNGWSTPFEPGKYMCAWD